MKTKDTREWKTVEVTKEEILNSDTKSSDVLLHLAQAKGAPIEGTFFLRMSRSYEWHISENHFGTVYVKWRPLV